jgi:hypothetical protein
MKPWICVTRVRSSLRCSSRLSLCPLSRNDRGSSSMPREHPQESFSHIFQSAHTHECNARWHPQREWIDPRIRLDAEIGIPQEPDQLYDEITSIRDDEDAANAVKLDHHLEILGPCQLLVHSAFLMEDAQDESDVDSKDEKDQRKSLDELFVESHNLAGRQITRRCTVSDGLVVGVLAWVEYEEDEIVDRRIEAAEAKREIVSEKPSGACDVPSAVKDENVPFERGPRDE